MLARLRLDFIQLTLHFNQLVPKHIYYGQVADHSI